MRKLLTAGAALAAAALLGTGSAQAHDGRLPVASDFAIVAPVSRAAVRRMPVVLPYDLRFHAQHDFYPRMRYRGRYFSTGIYVYQPQRRYHKRYGYRTWYRY